ncbi:MAG: hypothetical protein ACRC9R_04770, partial [Enterovibrio sp.]
IATAAPRQASAQAAAAPLTLHFPIEVLSWPELLRFLQEYFSMQNRPTSAATAAASLPIGNSAAGLIFQRAFIEQQSPILVRTMTNFNNERDPATCNLLFAKIICALKDRYELPEGTFSHVCKWLGLNRASVSSWFSNLIRREQARRMSQPQMRVLAPQMLAVQTGVQGPPALRLPASLALMPAATATTSTATAPIFTAPVPVTSASTTATAAPAQMPAPVATQTTAAPVFIAPATPGTSTATQLAPVLPPFFESTEAKKKREEEEKMRQDIESQLPNLPPLSPRSEMAFDQMLGAGGMPHLTTMDEDEFVALLVAQEGGEDGQEREDETERPEEKPAGPKQQE